jgi:hypothetical protein
MAKATILKIWQEKEVSTKNWKRRKYPLELSDWIKKRSNLQDTQNPFTEWMEIEYDLKEWEYPEIAVKKPRKWNGWFTPPKDYSKEKIISSMECACNILKHRWTKEVEELVGPLATKILKRYNDQWL